MIHTATATRGMVVAPHHLAAQTGLQVLREGGNAIEATVAAAAIAVVYPHMNAIGGDGFWIVHAPGAEPIAIDACGGAAAHATPRWYRSRGFDAIPARGPLAANTVAGTVSGWEAALAIARRWGGAHSLDRLLADAVHYAEHGVPVTASQHADTLAKRAALEEAPGFAEQFLPGGAVPATGDRFVNERLGRTLRRLAREGLDSFYRGPLAAGVAADLARIGSPLSGEDLERHRASVKAPLRLALRPGTACNLPPPTQGLASLMILGIFERLGIAEPARKGSAPSREAARPRPRGRPCGSASLRHERRRSACAVGSGDVSCLRSPPRAGTGQGLRRNTGGYSRF